MPMSNLDLNDTERRHLLKREAVEEAYDSLKVYHLDRRRIVLSKSQHKRSGGYGVVQKAELHNSWFLPTWFWFTGPPEIVAVKQIRMSAADDPFELKRAFTKELLVWSSLKDHSGIARFIGFCADFDRSEAWLLSPWEPHGNITDFTSRYQLEVPEKLSLVHDTIEALTFLHQLTPPVCHGDIKSANVLVNARCRAVFCDFGLARIFEDSGFQRLETSTGFKGSIRWCSPELLEGAARTPSSDVYAWAWLVWEIMTGEMPYKDTPADYVIIRRIFESPRPQVNGESRLSDCLQLWELMTRCWTVEPEQRPTSNMCNTTVTHLPRCTPTLEGTDPDSRSADLLEHLGDLETWKGNFRDGVVHLEKALRLHEQAGNAKGICGVLLKRAAGSYRLGEYAEAARFASAALDKLRAIDDDLGVADALYWTGRSLAMQSREDEAVPYLNEALETFRIHENDVGVVRCLERIGEIHRRNGRNDQALSALEDALVIACQSGDKLGEVTVTQSIGYLLWEVGDLSKATTVFTTSYGTARNIGYDPVACESLYALGSIKFGQGSYGEAEEILKESIAFARRTTQGFVLAKSLITLAKIQRRRGELSEAVISLQESWSSFQTTSFRGIERVWHTSLLAQIKQEQGDMEGALFWYEQAINESRNLKDKPDLPYYLAMRGEILCDVEGYDEAALSVEASLSLYEEQRIVDGVRWCIHRLASIPKTTMQRTEQALKTR